VGRMTCAEVWGLDAGHAAPSCSGTRPAAAAQRPPPSRRTAGKGDRARPETTCSSPHPTRQPFWEPYRFHRAHPYRSPAVPAMLRSPRQAMLQLAQRTHTAPLPSMNGLH
jgi:hypothetical protein